jgi:hypothetical protein
MESLAARGHSGHGSNVPLRGKAYQAEVPSQSSFWDLMFGRWLPNVETLGYCRMSPPDRHQYSDTASQVQSSPRGRGSSDGVERLLC